MQKKNEEKRTRLESDLDEIKNILKNLNPPQKPASDNHIQNSTPHSEILFPTVFKIHQNTHHQKSYQRYQKQEELSRLNLFIKRMLISNCLLFSISR